MSAPAHSDSASSGRLDDRVLGALEELHGRIPFSGLRRSLGAHPESLSRALRRLEREGLIERSSEGYRSTRPAPHATDAGAELHSIAQVDLPAGVDARAVLERLTGRWFGSLRWMGVVERPDERLLSWARRDGTGSVLLGVRGGTARIYASGDGELEESAESEDSAYELLVALADTLRPAAPHAPVTFFAADPAVGSGGRRRSSTGAFANN